MMATSAQRRPMRILLVHRFYWPDVTGYAQMLPVMAKSFANAGYDVSVYSTQPSYNDAYQGARPPAYERVDGVTVRRISLPRENKNRIALRAFNMVWFCMRLFLHCLWHRYDLVTVSTFPPAVMGLLARMIGLLCGTRYLYHCQDLYPEVALASGLTRIGLLSKIAASIDRRNCQKAEAVVVLSEDMKRTVADRGIATDNVRIINNFVIDRFTPVSDLPTELKLNPDKFKIIFAGNMGRFQGLETLIEAAHLLKDNDRVQFVFVGGGALTQNLKTRSHELLGKSVLFFAHQPLNLVMQMIHDAELSVVSLGPGVIRSAYPSKTMSNLEAGSRLLLVLEEDCELTRFVKATEVGVHCTQGDAMLIANAIRSEMKRIESQPHDDRHSRLIAQEYFGQDKILAKWHAVLDEIRMKLKSRD
jgi:colanic acid biosynthesis glycosyl transferase WcaI